MGVLWILPDKRRIRYDIGKRSHNRRVLDWVIESDMRMCCLTHGDASRRKAASDCGVDPINGERPKIQGRISGQGALLGRGIVRNPHESSGMWSAGVNPVRPSARVDALLARPD
jgi:hypothetical protein